MRIVEAAAVLSLLLGVGDLEGQEPEAQQFPDAEDSAKPTAMFVASAGLGTWDGEGAFAHVQAAFEDGWPAIGLNLIAEGGLAIGGGVGALTLTPGASLNLSSSPSPLYIRAGFSMFRTENLGFHAGVGMKTTRLGSGLRFEVRGHVFPGGGETDSAFEGLLTYQVPL